MKTKLILLAVLIALPVYGQATNGVDGGVKTDKGTQIIVLGADGKSHYAKGNNTGQLVVAPSGSPMPVSGTITTQPSGTPMPVTESGAWTVTTQPSGTPVPITATTPIPVTPKQLTGTPSSFTIQTADATVFTLAAGEIGFIQNLSADAPLNVKYGASASTSSFNFTLAPCTVANDGKGGAVRIDDWVGVVSVAKVTGTASYLAFKRAP